MERKCHYIHDDQNDVCAHDIVNIMKTLYNVATDRWFLDLRAGNRRIAVDDDFDAAAKLIPPAMDRNEEIVISLRWKHNGPERNYQQIQLRNMGISPSLESRDFRWAFIFAHAPYEWDSGFDTDEN